MIAFTPCTTCPSATACDDWGYCNAEAMREGEGKTATQVMAAREAKRLGSHTFSREDFELAAKAAGIEVIRSRLDDPTNRDMLIKKSPRNPHQAYGPWSPRDNDGDAMRLSTRLKLKLVHWSAAVEAHLPSGDRACFLERYEGNPDRATRYAILRAAVAAGRAMP